MASTDGGGVRIGRNGLDGLVGPDCGREFANTIIVHNRKMTKFLFISTVPFF